MAEVAAVDGVGGAVVVRPMRPDDVRDAERLSSESFYELDLRTHRPGLPAPAPRTPDHAAGWVQRTLHFLETDPGGCWVAEDATGMVGFATSMVRETTWVLATYAVRPGRQGRGTGRALLEAAMHHGRGCLRGMLSASTDPRAVRRYWAAGFTLHPQLLLTGTVDRSAIPVVRGVREATPGDRDLMDSLDRRARGAAHGPDHDLLLRTCRALVSDTTTGAGYVYLRANGGVELLAADNRRAATRLLWTALADGPEEQTVRHVTAANAWAVDVGMTARLEVHTEGYLALRGMRPPAPYLHSGALL